MPHPIEETSTPWSHWKAHSADASWFAMVTSGSITAGLLMFLIMFMQEPRRLLLVSGCTFLVTWLFFMGVSAANAYLLSHPKFAPPSAPEARHAD